MAKLQGTLDIESVPGEGTTLAVALPEEPGSLSDTSEKQR